MDALKPFYHTLADGCVQCDLCPHRCRLRNGQLGLCRARACEHKKIVSLVYGHPSGLAVEPVEKKPLFHFLPDSEVLSFGTIGCNLRCVFCQNWQLSQSEQKFFYAGDKIFTPEMIVRVAKKHHCDSIAFTYNEPSIFIEYAVDVAEIAQLAGIRTIAVTNGYINPEPRVIFYEHLDAVNVDLKGFDEGFYRRCLGGHLQPVLDTLLYLKHETKVWLEITNLLVPGENDTEKSIKQLVKWIAQELGPDVPLHFSAFYPAWKMMDKPVTPIETLQLAQTLARDEGLQYVYIGNVGLKDASNTYCAHCHTLLIERSNGHFKHNMLTSINHCPTCQSICQGVFA
jgi:pyruvate formate lyase activating enzyme